MGTVVSMNAADLMACANGTLMGKDAPRLPTPPILAFDEVMELNTEGGKYGIGYAIAKKYLDEDMEWVFRSHFDHDPVLPGSMMLEALLQLAGLCGAYLGAKGKSRAVRVDGVKFLSEVGPHEREVIYRVDIKKDMKNHSLFVAEGTVTSGGMLRASVDQLWLMISPQKGESAGIVND